MNKEEIKELILETVRNNLNFKIDVRKSYYGTTTYIELTVKLGDETIYRDSAML